MTQTKTPVAVPQQGPELPKLNTPRLPRIVFVVLRTDPRTRKTATCAFFFSRSYAGIFLRGLQAINPDSAHIFRIQEQELTNE